MVASEEIEPQWGWDYSSILTSLNVSPNQDGSSIGKKIADSFVVQSKSISAAKGYDAQEEITMSVVNLTKIAQLVNNLNLLANYLEHKVSDINSAISLTKSIDSSEGYGKTSTGGSGLVDIYDLSSNIMKRFPQSVNLVEPVQNSISDTIIYKINGSANPNAHGLSIYAPLTKEEFTGSRKYILDGWKGIMNLQYALLKSDLLPPFTQSTLSGDTIRGHINANDVAKVTLWIYTSSMPEGNTAIYQDLDPSSFIKSDGSFEYKWNKQILSLCDTEKESQQVCKPVSMKLETNKDKKFALIPARLTSNADNLDEPVSLKYDLNNGSKFTFLGARPNIKFEQTFQQGEDTVSKENWPIHKNDKVYLISYSFSSEEDNVNSLPRTEYLPIQIKDKMAMPKNVTYNGSFDIHFMVCDYSNNCQSSRWFHYNDTTYDQPQVVDLEGQKVPLCKSHISVRNFSTYTNPVYNFRLQYPSNWKTAVLTSTSFDDNVLQIRTQSPRDNKDFVFGEIDAGYSPLTKKQFLDGINTTQASDPFTKLVEFNSTMLGGYKAYKTVTITKGLGINEDKEQIQVEALIGHTDYIIQFTMHPSKSASYLPTINKILDSFELCSTKSSDNHEGQGVLGTKLDQNQMNTEIGNSTTYNHREPKPEFSTYINPIYGFKMKYMSDAKVAEEDDKTGVTFDFLTIIESKNPFLPVHEDKYGLYLGCYMDKDIIKQGATLYGFAQYVLHTKGKQEEGVNVTESKLIDFHGHPAYKIVYTSLEPFYKQQIKHMYIITIIGHDGYFFDYTGEASSYEQYLSIGENMLNSFQLGPTATYR
jgi:cysteine peptidase C11 family protein